MIREVKEPKLSNLVFRLKFDNELLKTHPDDVGIKNRVERHKKDILEYVQMEGIYERLAESGI